MNKKSATSISTLILVVMALLLCGAAIFVFLTSGKAQKIISDGRFIENLYVEEEETKLFLSILGKDILNEIYDKSLTNAEIENKFKEKFKERIGKFVLQGDRTVYETSTRVSQGQGVIIAYNTDDRFVNLVQQRVNSNDYSVNFDGSNLKLEFKGFKFYGRKIIKETKYAKLIWFIPSPFSYQEIQEQIGVIYTTDLHVEVLKENI